MRALIISDSHGSVYNLRQVLLNHEDINKIYFLGDGERDFEYVKEELGSREVIMVKGNCDLGSDLNAVELDRVEENLVMLTHGHAKAVKFGIDMLLEDAIEKNVKLLLYGHTHEQYTDYIDGVYIMNPGSLNNYEYGIADIQKDGIVLTKMDLLKR